MFSRIRAMGRVADARSVFAALASSCLIVVGVGMVTAAPAAADTPYCGWDNPYNVLTCVHIGYSGDPNTVAATARVYTTPELLQECLWIASGRVGCTTGYQYVGPGQVLTEWPNRDWVRGLYYWCARTWEATGSGDVMISNVCVQSLP